MNLNLPKMPAFVRTNTFVVCLCCLGAFVLWHYIHMNNNHKAVFPDIPVAFTFGSLTNGMVTASSVQHVTVTLYGLQDDIASVSGTEIKCNLVLDDKPGKQTYKITHHNISLPGKQQFTIEVAPSACTVETDYRRSKSVPVELVTQNHLPSGYERGASSFTPVSVEISGPAGKLDQIRQVSTKPLDLRMQSESLLNHRIALEPVANCVLDPEVVSLNLPISRSEIERALPPQPISVLGPLGHPMQLQVTPPTAVVRIKGPAETVNHLMNEGMIVYADARDMVESSSRDRPLRAIAPNGVTVLPIEPQFVTISAQGPEGP